VCLGIPGRIVEIRDDLGLAMGTVDFGGVRRDVCLAYVADEIEIGSTGRSRNASSVGPSSARAIGTRARARRQSSRARSWVGAISRSSPMACWTAGS